MPKLTVNRPFDIYVSSAHRPQGAQISHYTIHTPPLEFDNHMVLQTTLLSARIPASALYLETLSDRTLTVRVNVSAADGVGSTNYTTSVSVVIHPGSFTTASLASTLQDAVNSAFTTSHATTPIATELRPDAADRSIDALDSGSTTLQGNSDTTLSSAPQFSFATSATRNKMQVVRTDAGGKMVLGKFSLEVSGEKLASAMGLEVGTVHSYHYRDLSGVQTSSAGSDTYAGEFKVQTLAGGGDYGHVVSSSRVQNMTYKTDVYVHCNMGTDVLKTSKNAGGKAGLSNLLGVVPQYGAAYDEGFYMPPVPTTITCHEGNVSRLEFELRNEDGELIDFRGVDHLLQLRFSVIPEGTYRERQQGHFASVNSSYRRSTAYNRFPVT